MIVSPPSGSIYSIVYEKVNPEGSVKVSKQDHFPHGHFHPPFLTQLQPQLLVVAFLDNDQEFAEVLDRQARVLELVVDVHPRMTVE